MKNKDNSLIYHILAFVVGGVVAAMVVCNTRLALYTSNPISIAVNQAVGFLALSLIMVIGRKNSFINPKRERSRLWQWFGGLFGLVIISINYLVCANVNATLASAGAVLGQCIMGVVYDLTGFMGLDKRAVTKKKLCGLAISFIGILAMLISSAKGELSPILALYALLSLLSGALTMVQMVYNSAFARLKGTFFSARENVLSGFIGIALFILLFSFKESASYIKLLPSLPILTVISGGLLGIIIVILSNIIIPKISGAAYSILMSAGQILTALLLDTLLLGNFSGGLLLGALIMVAGIAVSA